MTRQEFAAKYYPDVVKATQGTGIFPETALSQMILESRAGDSDLARDANNFFGVKVAGKPTWTGPVYYIPTKEQDANGNVKMVNAAFRKYASVQDSIRDHVAFLQQNPRYAAAGVFSAKTVAEQAAALKAAGYATDVKYASLVTSVYDQIKDSISAASEVVSTTATAAIGVAKRHKGFAIFGGIFLCLSLGVGFTLLYQGSKQK